MDSPMRLLSLVALVVVFSSFSIRARALNLTATNLTDLVAAINSANDLGKVCRGRKDCLGELVSVNLTGDVKLNGSLPQLQGNAHISITGFCQRRGGRCYLDGVNRHIIFPQGVGVPFPTTAPGKLELKSLNFVNALGGVLYNVYAEVYAANCVFKHNRDGVVVNIGFYGGAPPQTFVKCQFLYNYGTAVTSGNGKLGLVAGDGVGFLFKRCRFEGNVGRNGTGDDVWVSGGAVAVAGLGTSIFENTAFVNNTAVSGGGAVFGDQTSLIFRGVSFEGNKALGSNDTGGGALFGISGVYQNMTASFCSVTFANNTTPQNSTVDSLLFRSYVFPTKGNFIGVAFCDTKIPPGSVFEDPPYGGVTNGTGQSCSRAHC